jgi:GWxTD domain-containing protein
VQAGTIELDDAELLAQGEVPAPGWIAYQPMPETVEGSTNASIEVLDAATRRTFLVPVPIDAASDAGARYALEVAVEGVGSAGRAIAPFAFHWRDMPIALHDAETAIRLLSFIESDMRIRALLQGTAADREVAFLQYWKERDPTPATPFNELMAEYYRRIDHAALTFRTGVGPIPDGLRTDQGRLYIVHGPPDHVERAFPPSGGVTETWTYDNGSRFVFWAASSLEPLALQRD